MRSRSWSELLPLVLGAVVQGVWSGAIGALVSSRSGPAFIAFASLVVLAAAVLARKSGSGKGPGRAARAAAAALALATGGGLYVLTQAWERQPLVWAVVIAGYCSALVLLGISLGNSITGAETATRRAVRGFAILCAVLVVAAIAGAEPPWATGAVVAALVAGGLLVTAARYDSLTAVVPAADRAPAWRWLLAVAGVLLLVVAVGALVGLVVRVDVVLWALAAVGGVLRFLAQLLAYGLGWAGAGLIRLVSWVLGLFHVHRLPLPQPPTRPSAPHALAHKQAPTSGIWGTTRAVTIVLAAVLAVAGPLALVALALKRFGRAPRSEVIEERESVASLRAVAGGTVARVGGRLRRLVPHHRPPGTPAETVRRRYADLERRLARSGHGRPPGTTVRQYLRALPTTALGMTTASLTEPAAAPTAPITASPPPSHREAAHGADEVAGLYEIARYSPHEVDGPTAQRFLTLVARFDAAVLTSP